MWVDGVEPRVLARVVIVQWAKWTKHGDVGAMFCEGEDKLKEKDGAAGSQAAVERRAKLEICLAPAGEARLAEATSGDSTCAQASGLRPREAWEFDPSDLRAVGFQAGSGAESLEDGGFL